MSDAFLGEIRLMPYSFTTNGWVPCDGRLLPYSGNQALYSLLTTAFGGDGVNTFGVPDLRGRVIVGALAPVAAAPGKPGVNSDSGEAGGAESVALTLAEMPLHNHNIAATRKPGDNANTANAVFATATDQPNAAPNVYGALNKKVTIDSDSLAAAGQGQPHNNMQPYTALTYCICVSGNYPDFD